MTWLTDITPHTNEQMIARAYKQWRCCSLDLIPARDGKRLYLWRFILLRTPWFQVMLHWFAMSDEDPCLHDHPWPFVTFILWGGYDEVLGYLKSPDWIYSGEAPPDAERHKRPVKWFQRPGSILFRRAEHFHRVILRTDKHGKTIHPITLVITGRKCRSWGFYAPDGWVYWKDFLKRREAESVSSE